MKSIKTEIHVKYHKIALIHFVDQTLALFTDQGYEAAPFYSSSNQALKTSRTFLRTDSGGLIEQGSR